MLSEIKPPTDNLYKFMALFGLALMALSFWLQQNYWDAFSEEAKNQTILLGRQQSTETRAMVVKARNKAIVEDEPNSMKELAEIAIELNELIEEKHLNKDLVEISEYVNERRFNWGRWFWIPLSIGGLLSVAGFTLWYVRVQRIEDVLKNRSLNSTQPSE